MNLADLRLTAQALLDLDAAGALVPHGLGNIPRTVIAGFLDQTAPGRSGDDVRAQALGQLETGLAFIAAGENEESRMAARLRGIAAQALAYDPQSVGGPIGQPAQGMTAGVGGLSRNKEALLIVLLEKMIRERAANPLPDLPRYGLSRDRAAVMAMIGGAGPQDGAPGAGKPVSGVAPPDGEIRAPTAPCSAPAALSRMADDMNRPENHGPGASTVFLPARCRPETYADGTQCATCGRAWGYDGPDECPLEKCYGN